MSSQEFRDDRQPSLAPKSQAIEASWVVQNSESDSDSEANAKSSRVKHQDTENVGRFLLKSPLIVRSDGICQALELSKLPVEVYALLSSSIKRVGGALLATVEDLAAVPLREIPFRIAPIQSNAMPSVDAFMSADAIELQLGDWTPKTHRAELSQNLSLLRTNWPIDVPDLLRLAKKIELLRCLAQSSVPVGVAIPFGDTSADSLRNFHWLSEIGIDFVTIRSAAACLGYGHPALPYLQDDPVDLTRKVKSLFDRPGKKAAAIIVDYPWKNGYQAAQTILAGASFVGVDGHLATSIPSVSQLLSTSASDSLSSGIFSRSSVHSTSEEKLSLRLILQKLDLHSALSLFSEQLRSALEYSQ